MSTPQHRCVFVGNIPYDATEEQLVQICEEVGPVVSFRLVIDRETGKPKGYGFCEYRDEETAASARRNLQGYEINGRQLRVDYAENDKGVERNREQGRGGPGLASNYDNQKQSSGSSFPGDSLFAQPIGIAAAASAASVMAAALGEPQVAMLDRNQGASHSRTNPTTGSDPLTLHLASMSKKQLFDILHEIKVLAQQNQEHARQLLSAYPTLAKAIFQAQIILGIVSPQMASNFKQDVETQASQQGQLQVGQVKMEPGLVGHGQMIQQTQSQNMSVPPLVKQPAFLSKTQHGHSRSSSVMSSLGNMHQPALQQPPRLPYQAGSQSKVFKPSSSQNQILSEIPHETVSHGNAESLHQATSLSDIFLKNHNRIEETTTGFGDFRAALNASTSLTNIDDGNVRNYKSDGVSSGPNLMSTDNGSVTEVGLSQPLVPNAVEGTQPTQQAMFQQITPEMESVLLQQVMSLTPEQIKSLPAEQQQQVLQLQQLFHSSVSS